MSGLWATFRNSPLGELITGTAHQSHPTDLTDPLPVRFANRTLLAVHVALEKAATVRVAFDADGVPTLSHIRNINRRDSAEFTQVLRAEAVAIGSPWAAVVLATGWQAVLGQRAARPEPGEHASPFSRYALMFDAPELVYRHAQSDRVYTAVDHPVLDRSVVFSVRRNELEELFSQLQMAGLRVASVKITIAAQLEAWLASRGESGLERDLLITDGLGALLLNVDRGDFIAPRDSLDTAQPRQSVQRPSAAEEDIVRFATANGNRPISFLGPQELYDSLKRQLGERELIRPPAETAHDTHTVALCAHARHDLNFDAREARPAVAKTWRRVVVGYIAVLLLLLAIAATNAGYALRLGYRTYEVERESARSAADAAADGTAATKIVDEFQGTRALQAWVAGNFHAQQFCYALLKEVPDTAAIDKLAVEMTGGQITVTFLVLGEPSAQLRSRRAIENAIKSLRYNIGAEDPPIATSNGTNAVQYRMHVLVSDAFRGRAT